MVDAQFTNVRVLKPFEDFERRYQGKPAFTPIAFPGVRDQRAQNEEPGYDPNLEKGIAIPQGSRVLLQFPICFARGPVFPFPTFTTYSYRLIWRYQNLGSFRNPAVRSRRAPYHFPRQSPGAPDSTFGPPVPRVTLPASWHVVAYQQTEPPGGNAANLVARIEMITPNISDFRQFAPPILPDGQIGVIQQGVTDPFTASGGQMPIYVPFETDAAGDELIILANRSDAFPTMGPLAAPWDFTSNSPTGDLPFSNIYGTGNGAHPAFRDIGIYLQTGTAP
jgi:hypothetical protein